MAVASSFLIAHQAYAEEEKTDDIEVIQVSGIRGSLTQAISLKKENVQIVDSIIAEDIGKFPDNNVVEALQRVSGVQTTGRGGGEVSGVTIRGLGDVSTTVNGRQIFTSIGRSVALADIPASLLNSVDVYKTRSANLIEGGIAGQIDIKTNRPFNFQGDKVVVAARGIYMDSSDKVDPNVSILASNRWETGLGDFGALFNASYAKSNYRDQNIWIGSSDPYRADDFTRIPASAVTPGEELSTKPGSTINVNGVDTEYVMLRDAMGFTDFTGERERPAMNLSLQWAPTDNSEYLFEAFYNGYRDQNFNSLLFSFVNGNNHFRAPEFYEGTNVIKKTYINDAALFTSGDGGTGKTDSFVYALGGKWEIGDDLILNSEVVYQTSTYERSFVAIQTTSSRDRLAVDFNHNGSGNPAFSYLDDPSTPYDEGSLTDVNAYTMGTMFDNSGKDTGDAITWTLDGDYALYAGMFETVDFGVRYNKRTAKSQSKDQSSGACSNNGAACVLADIDGLAYTTESGFYDNNAYVPNNWLSTDGNWMINNIKYLRGLYGLDLNGGDYLDERTFDITEQTIAAYLQTNYATELFGLTLDGQIGVRVVNSKTDLSFNELAASRVEQTTEDTNVLPSFMARYYLTDDLLLRFAYGKTISLPNFGDLNPTMSLTPPNPGTNQDFGYASSGNPNLKPVESQNFDLSLEWYFAESSSLYGVLFRRDVDGFVYSANRNIEITNNPNPDYNAKYVLTQPLNAGKGTLQGLELGFTWFPDDLPEWLQGIGLQTSYTYIDGDTKDPIYSELPDGSAGPLVGYETNPLIGVSENSYSVVLAYEKEDYSARLSYVYRDEFLTGYNFCCSMPTGTYSDSEANMDFQFSWNVTPDWVLTFDATNLTGEEYHSAYTDFNLYNSGSTIISRTFALGTRYAF
ncbi:TonB-dependent receptor [Shewanella sp. AS1]|uniref:TonB-dependent receptor n=1 Tax=Shewanella sp. AS1 TaxID=2907626 RepID=UPI001F2DEF2C|nr:TonB-dependent receptor [Shewanella sp. AS1]MCE9678504.1 TonB-dependent receptor [Shewanella sp. AS1]